MIREIKVNTIREETEDITFSSPKIIRAAWNKYIKTASWYDPEKEMAVVFCLGASNRIKSFNLVSIGSVSESVCHPREVFRPAVMSAASGIILAHNHPGGGKIPSNEDLKLSRKLKEAGDMLSIRLLDSIIITDNGYTSMRESGLL